MASAAGSRTKSRGFDRDLFMTDPDNLTPFGFGAAFQFDLDAAEKVVLCVAGRFELPPAGKAREGELSLDEEQRAPSMADEHWADPASSSLRYPSQGVVRRTGTEIYLQGSAWAAGGRKSIAVPTRVTVGACSKQVDIVGNRFWRRGVLGLSSTAPEPFEQLPLRYEQAFGGTLRDGKGTILAQEARNPIGRGFFVREQDAIDQPLPNVQRPGERAASWNVPTTPEGYGPIPGSWQPRLGFAGTYDQKWIDERVPLWPLNLDPRFFAAAALGMTVPQALRGGEPVTLEGFSPDGAFHFKMPSHRIVAKAYYDHQTLRARMLLDGVLFEPDENSVTLYWRSAFPLGHGPRAHRRSIVRLLESWEEDPS